MDMQTFTVLYSKTINDRMYNRRENVCAVVRTSAGTVQDVDGVAECDVIV